MTKMRTTKIFEIFIILILVMVAVAKTIDNENDASSKSGKSCESVKKDEKENDNSGESKSNEKEIKKSDNSKEPSEKGGSRDNVTIPECDEKNSKSSEKNDSGKESSGKVDKGGSSKSSEICSSEKEKEEKKPGSSKEKEPGNSDNKSSEGNSKSKEKTDKSDKTSSDKGSTKGKSEEKEKKKDFSECQKTFCAAIWSPVCAFNGKCYKTFSSSCVLDHYNCGLDKHSQFKNYKDGECCDKPICTDDFNLNCSDDEQYVCAHNGKCFETFINICHLHKRNLCNKEGDIFRLRGHLACKDFCAFRKLCGEEPDCPKSCSDKGKSSICGFNGKVFKTFSNACYIGKANCNEDTIYDVVSKGKCKKHES